MLNTDSSTISQWDMLSDRFDTHKAEGDIHPDAAVNHYVGWPTFIKHIKTIDKKEPLRILDFGCGTGEFCLKLSKMGYKTCGVERSLGLLNVAKEKLSDDITLADLATFEKEVLEGLHREDYDVITSIHVFDWIEDLTSIIFDLSKLVKKNGLILFSVFPKEHVIDSIRIKDLFENCDSNENPTKCIANFEGVKVPVYIKEAGYYDSLFSDLGFEKILQDCPGYPDEFLKKYEWKGSLEPEMMILGYRKLY